MIWFICGLCIGTSFGILLSALLRANDDGVGGHP